MENGTDGVKIGGRADFGSTHAIGFGGREAVDDLKIAVGTLLWNQSLERVDHKFLFFRRPPDTIRLEGAELAAEIGLNGDAFAGAEGSWLDRVVGSNTVAGGS